MRRLNGWPAQKTAEVIEMTFNGHVPVSQRNYVLRCTVVPTCEYD